MPTVKTVDGTVIECTAQELASVLAVLQQARSERPATGNGNGNTTPVPLPPRPLTTSDNTVVWTEARARALWNWFYGDQKTLIDLLMQQPMMSPQIQKAMKIDGHVLSGLLSCITRNAKRETKYKEAHVVSWKPQENGKGVYYILPEVKELFERVR